MKEEWITVATKYLKRVPSKYQPLFGRCVSGQASPRERIKAFCQQCIGYSEIPESITECSAYRCPLWNERPYQNSQKKEVQ